MVMRLDKYLAQAGIGTRSEVKKIIRQGRVFIDGTPAKRPEEKVGEGSAVEVDGMPVQYEEYEYFMLNKPAGVVTAVRDREHRTVLDLLDCPHSPELFPVGRLDKDTEGLLLLTNDGALAHGLLSPKKHVEKTYFVRVEGKVEEEDIRLFADGVDIGDERLTKPAVLEVLSCLGNQGEGKQWKEKGENGAEEGGAGVSGKQWDREQERGGGVSGKSWDGVQHRGGEGEEGWQDRVQGSGTQAEVVTEALVTITEGRYHQVKRMFQKIGKPVRYLKRCSMGGLVLDEDLALGEYRPLTEAELKGLRSKIR